MFEAVVQTIEGRSSGATSGRGEGEKWRVWGKGEKGAVIGLRVLVYSGNSTDEWGNVSTTPVLMLSGSKRVQSAMVQVVHSYYLVVHVDGMYRY